MKMVIISLLLVLALVGMVSAETTFFEGGDMDFLIKGETNYNETVFCGNAVCDFNESCGDCRRDCGFCGGSTGLATRDEVEDKGLRTKGGKREMVEEVRVIEKEKIFSVREKIFSGFGALILVGVLAYLIFKKKLRKKAGGKSE